LGWKADLFCAAIGAFGSIMRLSRTGLALCAFYTFASASTWIYASNMAGDPKGRAVLMQLPVILAHVVALELGLLPILGQMPELVACGMLFIPTLAAIYWVGWGLMRLISTAPRSA
jgi:hypothetical protein